MTFQLSEPAILLLVDLPLDIVGIGRLTVVTIKSGTTPGWKATGGGTGDSCDIVVN